ncbi:hypothetical protein BH10PLA2_BH10PLA2_38900 [soil metagenome]
MRSLLCLAIFAMVFGVASIGCSGGTTSSASVFQSGKKSGIPAPPPLGPAPAPPSK